MCGKSKRAAFEQKYDIPIRYELLMNYKISEEKEILLPITPRL